MVQLVAPYWKAVLLGTVCLMAGGAINLFFPYLAKLVLNRELGLSLERDLSLLLIVALVLLLAQCVLFFVRDYTFTNIGWRVLSDLRHDVYQKLLHQGIPFFDEASTGDLLSRLSNDTTQVQRGLTVNISIALRYLFQAFGAFVMMLVLSPKLTLLITLGLPLVLLGIILWAGRLRRASRLVQDRLGRTHALEEEVITGVRTVRSSGAVPFELTRHAAALDDVIEAGVTRSVTAAMFSASITLLLYGGVFIVLWYGALGVIAGTLASGDLLAFLMYCALITVACGFLARVWDELMQASGAAERLEHLVHAHSGVDLTVAERNELPADARAAGAEVIFRTVSFTYPSRPEIKVLHEIDVALRPGQHIAVVGPTGAGKSTLVGLLLRFYKPESGEIVFDGRDLDDINEQTLRKDIAVVPQDPRLFSVSIRDNITYGLEGVSDREVAEACRAAQLEKFISSLPDGYNTQVGDRGVQLSGGERQRVAIARALLRKPRLLILDEATSALDSQNEHLVRDALRAAMQGRTVLTIAHRLATVQDADEVIVMRNGQIEQRGLHETLAGEEGLYRDLVSHQLLKGV